jgi:spore germination cell wall hydrolase CwlJ-like protein
MPRRVELRIAAPLAALPLALLGGCASLSPFHRVLSERECMTRVMYFESNRSSDDGMLAVGTVVMNRLESGRYPHTVCGVVGQRGQFAPGVLSLPMNPREAARASRIADAVLHGARHPGVGKAMFFHTAGYSFPYDNMHYVLVAGGNAFYEKVPTQRLENPSQPHGIGNMIARLFSGIMRL